MREWQALVAILVWTPVTVWAGWWAYATTVREWNAHDD